MKFVRGLVVALATLFGGPAWATDFVAPPAKIVVSDGNDVVAPGKAVPLGELVDVSVTKPDGPVQYLQGVSYEWKILENGKERKFKTSGDQSAIWYAAGIKPKRQQVFCVATYLFAVRERPEDPKSKVVEVGVRTQFLYVEVVIGDAPPEPGPSPGPAPTPNPDTPNFPDGKYKLSRWAYETAMAKVPAANRAKAAAALADSFKGIASAVAAGGIKKPEDVLTKTQQSNESKLAELKVPKSEWEPFFKDLQEKVYALYESDAIATLGDFQSAWAEISSGLAAIK